MYYRFSIKIHTHFFCSIVHFSRRFVRCRFPHNAVIACIASTRTDEHAQCSPLNSFYNATAFSLLFLRQIWDYTLLNKVQWKSTFRCAGTQLWLSECRVKKAHINNIYWWRWWKLSEYQLIFIIESMGTRFRACRSDQFHCHRSIEEEGFFDVLPAFRDYIDILELMAVVGN